MELAQDLVGQYVTIQLARPLFVTDYGCTVLDRNSQAVIGYVLQPSTNPPSDPSAGGGNEPLVMDVFVGVKILRITDATLTFEYISPRLNLVERSLPLGLVLCVDRMSRYRPRDLPTMDNELDRIISV